MRKKFKNILLLMLLVLVLSFSAKAQEEKDMPFMGIIQNGDTLIHKNIKEVVILPKKEFRNKRVERRYWRYAAKVKKVYPLAMKARELLEVYEPVYTKLEDPKKKKKMMKNLEKELLAEHKEELKKWSISDGRILLKLINRETERTPYMLIETFRGEFSAFFWQGVARLFKNDLKAGYDPDGEDQWLEEIVTMIELGYI